MERQAEKRIYEIGSVQVVKEVTEVKEKVETVEEKVKEVVKVVEEVVPDSCSFMCLGWTVSLRKVQTPLKTSPPTPEETLKTKSKSESPSVPEEELPPPKVEPTV